MQCEECGTDKMLIIESYTTPSKTYRVRKCRNPECDWRCVTHERFVNEYRIPTKVRNVARKQSAKARLDNPKS